MAEPAQAWATVPATPEGKATSRSNGAIHLLGTTVTGSA